MLSRIVGARVEKIYCSSNELLMKVYTFHGDYKIYCVLPYIILLTRRDVKVENNDFGMLLRKHLTGKRIEDVYQVDNERIICLEFDNAKLYFELFHTGNIILCDKNDVIIMPLRKQRWRDRNILPKEKYKYFSFSMPTFDSFREMRNSDRMVVVYLASELRLGGYYAEKICEIAGIAKDKRCNELSNEEIERLYQAYKRVVEEAMKSSALHLNAELHAYPEGKMLDWEELEDYFFEHWEREKEEILRKYYEEMKREIDEQIARLKTTMKELEAKAENYRKIGDAIFLHYYLLKDALNKPREYDGKEVSGLKFKLQGNKLIVTNDLSFELYLHQDLAKQAQDYYEKSKKLKGKTERIKERIEEIKQLKPKPPEIRFTRKKQWYEKFRWTIYKGYLAIGGKDANQNEALIRKYLEPNDIVFHAEIHGSPFVILKRGKQADDEVKREIAIFTLCWSKAWRKKIPVDVYWVYPDQLTKGLSGYYVARGAFVIRGKKNYIRDVELKYCLAVKDGMVISGSEKIASQGKYIVKLVPGDEKKEEIARKIKEYWVECDEMNARIPIEEILAHIPGEAKIVWS